MAVQLTRLDLEEYLWSWYPQASNILYLPRTFSAIIKSVIQNSSSGHLYYDLIFKQVAHDFVNFDKAQFEEEFPTDCSMVDWCIHVVIDNYISVPSQMLQHHDRKNI